MAGLRGGIGLEEFITRSVLQNCKTGKLEPELGRDDRYLRLPGSTSSSPQYIERLSSERNPHTAQRTAGMHAIDAGGTRTREHFDFMRADQRDRWAWRTVADRQGRIKAGDVGATVVHRAIEVNHLPRNSCTKALAGSAYSLSGTSTCSIRPARSTAT